MINKGTYFVLTLLNILGVLYLTGFKTPISFAVFFGGILLNHYFLVVGVDALAKSQKKSFFLVLKFFALTLVFIYVMLVMPELALYCVSAYIFQLIILGLSIKREGKKN